MAMHEYITNDGYKLLQRMLSGECTIDFTRIEMGDGNSSDPDLRKVKSLTNTVVSLVIDQVIKQEDNTISVSAIFTNKGLENGFFFKEKGIFATDGNKEILFSYANEGSAGNYIDSPTVELVEKKILTHITQCQKATDPINVVIKSGLYVDYATYDKHLNDSENPHKVTKEQIGLSDVDNTHDVDKPVSVPVQEALDAYYAQLTAYADKAIADVINGAPTTLDTLKELADAIQKNQSIQEALDAAIGTKANQNEFDSHVSAMASKTAAGHVKVDDAMSSTSTNPVQNKVVKAALDGKSNTGHTHNYAGSDSAGGAANNLKYFKSTSTENVGINSADINAIGYSQIVDYFGSGYNGALFKQIYDSYYAFEIFGRYIEGDIIKRSKENGTWGPWARVLDTENTRYLSAQVISYNDIFTKEDYDITDGRNSTSGNCMGMCENWSGTHYNDVFVSLMDKEKNGFQIIGHNEENVIGIRGLNKGKWSKEKIVITSDVLFGESIAIGYGDVYAGYNGVAIGTETYAELNGVAIGNETCAGVSGLAIGNQACAEYTGGSAIGVSAVSTGIDVMQLGSNSSLSALKCKVALSVTSDERDKTDFQPIDKALDFIEELEPVSFVSNQRLNYAKEDLTKEEEKNYRLYGQKPYDKEEHAKGTKKGTRRRTGLRAQQVIEALEKVYGSADVANIVNDNFFDIEDKSTIPEGIENQYTITYESLIPYLISGMKELSDKVNDLEKQLNNNK